MKPVKDLRIVIEFREELFKENFLARFQNENEWIRRKTIATQFHTQYPIQSIKEMDGSVLFEKEVA